MKKRKILILVLAVAVVSALSIGATLAWFTDTDDATNTFTVGNVAIDLTEPGWDEEVESENVFNVYPSKILNKDPQVENIGVNPCWVRIQIEWPELPGEGDIICLTGSRPMLGRGWIRWFDGYYYYIFPLSSGESTTPLFEQIRIPTGMTNGDPQDLKDIIVTAEAVQAQYDFPVRAATSSESLAVDDTVPEEELEMFENAFGAETK